MTDPRRIAFDILRQVDEDDAYANLALADALREARLSARDAALATELVSGTLRLRGSYDPIIDALITRELDPPVRDLLRLGAHQLLSMRVPDHAAISETVRLTKSTVGHRPSGFVNAVLRKLAVHSLDHWLRRVAPDPVADLHGYLSVVYSHPRWIVAELLAAVSDPEQIEPLLAANNARPSVHLAALKMPPEELAAQVGGTATPTSPIGVELLGGHPGAVDAVRAGLARVQDAGSQLVALTLAEAPLEGSDQRWLDLCAGPGGKAALLAELASRRGAHLTANEVSVHRAGLVAQALASYDVDVVVGDGRSGPWQPGSFDRVLVDAPCSGLGALRRRPEARWRKQPSDLDQLVELQGELLAAALEAVRPGGLVAYATCSPVLSETVGVVERLLVARPDARLVQIANAVGESPHMAGAVQMWPHLHGTDAMFVALLTRDSL